MFLIGVSKLEESVLYVLGIPIKLIQLAFNRVKKYSLTVTDDDFS